MKKSVKYIAGEKTIIRFLTGDLSESERSDFDNWIIEDPENRILFEDVKKIWDNSRNIEDFQSIKVNEDWLKVRKRMNFKENKSSALISFKESLHWAWRVAAVIILILGIGFITKQVVFTPPEMILMSTGDFKNEIMLPDGSKVLLNKYSELKYPEKFKRNSRQVSLTGEGYFEVIHNPDKLFRISIDNQAFVEVLGTSFNLRSDKEKGSVEVRVVSGKVAFYLPAEELNKTILIKDEEATYKNGTISKDKITDKNFLSWKTGILLFENEKIENVFNELTGFYNKKFIIKDAGNNDIRFTSKFDNQKLESVIEEIKLVLNLDYTQEGDTILFWKSQ
jgi:transmembrane sensor